jgi:hypothetical protein
LPFYSEQNTFQKQQENNHKLQAAMHKHPNCPSLQGSSNGCDEKYVPLTEQSKISEECQNVRLGAFLIHNI